MARKILDLVALREPVAVLFPSGVLRDVEMFRGEGQAMLIEYRSDETPVERRALLLQQLLRLAVPTASEEDWASMAFEDWAQIIGAANGNAELVEALRKNEVSDSTVSQETAP